ncbi:MAG: DUF86 domain-containing protein [Ignavibacteriales bacterium]|nr:DUF86 domain-containing protein [Ignavibacteriales bacterium]
MSNRDWKLLFEDILESIGKIQSYSKNLSFDDFEINSLIIDGVVRNIEIIGEASKNIPADIQKMFTDIPWQKLKGIRNRIVHDYFEIDVTIIWFIIQNELTPLKDILTKHLSKNQ